MTYYTRQATANPHVRKSVTRDGTNAPNGYYPNVIMGTSEGGPKEVHRGPQNMTASNTVRPSFTQNDTRVVYQRYSWFRNSSTLVPQEELDRFSGIQDPLASGQARQTVRTFARSLFKQQGTTDTRNLDNTVVPKSRVGQQDGVSWTVKVDPVLANPRITPESDESSVMRIPPAGPHGLHSRNPQNNKAKTNANYSNQPQQTATGQNKLANSNRAGQTYSATTKHLTQTSNLPYARGVSRGTR